MQETICPHRHLLPEPKLEKHPPPPVIWHPSRPAPICSRSHQSAQGCAAYPSAHSLDRMGRWGEENVKQRGVGEGAWFTRLPVPSRSVFAAACCQRVS
jgi:hypothetical protein